MLHIATFKGKLSCLMWNDLTNKNACDNPAYGFFCVFLDFSFFTQV